MRSDAWVLAFDTSAAHCAAALLHVDNVVAQASEDMSRGQAERLLPMLEDILKAGAIQWSDLDLLAVGVGPGNFTGVRIAVSAARGLSLGLGIPAIGVSVFEACAEGLPRPICVLEDARRNEVYFQRFDPDPGPPQLLSLSEAACLRDVNVTGSAAETVATDTKLIVHAPPYPLAEAIARVAARKASVTQPRPAPLYVRQADAAPSAHAAPPILA